VGRRTAPNFALTAGGIRRPHPRPDIWGARVRECVVVIRHPAPQTPQRVGRFEIRAMKQIFIKNADYDKITDSAQSVPK